MNEVTSRLAVVETKLDRVITDLEDDRGRAAHNNMELTARVDRIDLSQRRSDRIVYMGLGALGLLQFILQARGS